MGIVTTRFNKDDKPREDLLSIFGSTSDLIEEKRAEGQKVLVHCRMGISRSVTLVMAYCMSRSPCSFQRMPSFLPKYANVCAANVTAKGVVVMRAWGVGYSEAQIFVKGKRPMASPNRGFCEQLRVWQACEYGVEQIVDGERRDKAPYAEWKRRVGIGAAEGS